ncbi:hypothetical protein C8R48DRAFT_673682 [Suillus tomentosus]|nr:hypothetical protein C8R48DRAFT_673682 [Suillus tomentosus]
MLTSHAVIFRPGAKNAVFFCPLLHPSICVEWLRPESRSKSTDSEILYISSTAFRQLPHQGQLHAVLPKLSIETPRFEGSFSFKYIVLNSRPQFSAHSNTTTVFKCGTNISSRYKYNYCWSILTVNPFLLWLFLLVIDLRAFVVSVVVDCTESQDSYTFNARLESIMVLDFPMVHGEFYFCDGTIESSIGLHGLDKVVFIEDGQRFWLKIVLYAIEMQRKFVRDRPVHCFIIHLRCMFNSFSVRGVRSCANWDDLTATITIVISRAESPRSASTDKRKLRMLAEASDDSGYRQKGSQVLPKVRI